jgi:16S rRNA (guanine(966)-N(2))-methyltransferase RsmD
VADAGRVIAGTAKGIRLVAAGPATRPIADRVKQTLFAILEPDLPGARVLDLFAGSGACGIEALSRGAAWATFVERDQAALAAIAENLRRASLVGATRVVADDALAALGPGRQARQVGPYDLVIVDPPYDEPELLERTLAAVTPLLGPGARVVAKHFWRDRPPDRIGLLASERVRRFGETALTFYRLRPDQGGADR